MKTLNRRINDALRLILLLSVSLRLASFRLVLSRLLLCWIFSFSALVSVFASANSTIVASSSTSNNPLRIAVASNFAPVLTELLKGFTEQTHIQTQIITAASGTLYQQIKHGAPYDVFLSADSIRPAKLVKENLAIPQSQITYAYGLLALWSANKNINSIDPLYNVKNTATRLGIANPNYAPYGLAAKQLLVNLKLWDDVHKFLIQGININQTFVQVRSKSVPLGLVALSQLKINKLTGFAIPQNLYTPIKQQLVILKRTHNLEDAEQLKTYLLSQQVQQQLPQFGYAI